MTQHPRLMSPLKLRDQTLRNRIVFGAHTNNMSDQGMPGPRFGKYLLERALAQQPYDIFPLTAQFCQVHHVRLLVWLHEWHDGSKALCCDRG